MKKILLIIALVLIAVPCFAKEYSTTFTADATKAVATFTSGKTWDATVRANGTWGSGTITWYHSLDACSTNVALKDLSGTTVTSTADDMFNVTLGNAHTKMQYLCATLAGATNPSLTVKVYDNN